MNSSYILRLNAKSIQYLQKHEYENAHNILKEALKMMKKMAHDDNNSTTTTVTTTTNNNPTVLDQLYIAYANTYNNIACVHRSQKNSTYVPFTFGKYTCIQPLPCIYS